MSFIAALQSSLAFQLDGIELEGKMGWGGGLPEGISPVTVVAIHR